MNLLNNNYCSFNHSENFVCFGTKLGFYVFLINPFRKIIFRDIEGGVSLIKMLYETNIFLFVGLSDGGLYPNNKLIVWDDNKKIVISEIQYSNQIINIDLTRNHIIVCTKDKIFIYHFDTLTLINSIDTVSNPKGLMAIGPSEKEFIVYPSSNIGYIEICNFTKSIDSLNSRQSFQAHQNNIDNIYVNHSGEYIVTSSEKGTLIRIFNAKTFEKVKEFRRGSDSTLIKNINMSHNLSMLLVSSDKGTIHLFNTNLNPNLELKNKTFDNFAVSYIKFALPDYFNSEWSFAQFHLKNIITYSCFDKESYRLYSFGNDGQFYILNFEDVNKPIIEKNIKFISDDNDPFNDRNNTIK